MRSSGVRGVLAGLNTGETTSEKKNKFLGNRHGMKSGPNPIPRPNPEVVVRFHGAPLKRSCKVGSSKQLSQDE